MLGREMLVSGYWIHERRHQRLLLYTGIAFGLLGEKLTTVFMTIGKLTFLMGVFASHRFSGC